MSKSILRPVGIVGGMPSGKDGRVHTLFTHNPSTLRLASQQPNLQNLPRGSKDPLDPANLIRNLIVPQEGSLFLARDYCVSPTSKILKSDLTWVEAASIKVGDELIGFDDNFTKQTGLGKGKRQRNKFKPSIVTAVRRITRPTVVVSTTQGETTVSEEHRFVASYDKGTRHWIEAKDLEPGMTLPFLSKPWEEDISKEGGYLAGFLDGEGWLHKTNVGFGQNTGPVLDYVLKLLDQKGFEVHRHGRVGKCFQYAIVSGIGNQLRLLGTIRPKRLLEKTNGLYTGRQLSGKCSKKAIVLHVNPYKEQDVIAITTTTSTFISDGFFSHNCGIEAVLVGYLAGLPDYIRLAKRDVHTFYTMYGLYQLEGRILASDLPDLSWPDERLFAHLAHWKGILAEERNSLFKHLVHGCVTGEHEVLTPEGWVRFDQLKDGEKVAQWHPNGSLDFVTPLKVTRAPYVGPLHKWSSRSLSAVMTPNHRIPLLNSFGKLQEFTPGTAPIWGKVPTTGMLHVEGAADPHIKLAVAIQADGAVHGNHIRFHLVRPRKIKQLKTLLTELDIPFSETPCKCHQGRGLLFGINVSNTRVWDYLEKGKGKMFKLAHLLTTPTATRKMFLDELPFWDGTRRVKGRGQTSYMSTCLENVEAVQLIAHITGQQAILRMRAPSPKRFGSKPVFMVSFNKRQFASVEAVTQSITLHKEPVYCVSVPSSWFLIRHNNQVSVTGNSNFMQGPKGAAEKIYKETGIQHPVKKVSDVMEVYFSLFPGIRRWHNTLLAQVEKDGFVKNPAGYAHRFMRPYKYEKIGGKWVKEPGDDANKIVAFGPQSTAAAIMKESLLRLFHQRFEEAGQWLRLTVHDEVFCEVPETLAHEVDGVLKEEMERPLPFLPLPASWGMGPLLSIDTEEKVGRSWGSMKGWKSLPPPSNPSKP